MWLQAPNPAVTKPDPLQYGYKETDVGITPVILPEYRAGPMTFHLHENAQHHV